MKTRAVLLASSGAVHRVVSDSNGGDVTKCGQHYTRHAKVTPLQALVWPVAPCGDCWREREHQWQHFVEGVEL